MEFEHVPTAFAAIVPVSDCASFRPRTGVPAGDDVAGHERAVEYIVDDCFFTVGQTVGTRKTLEYEAVVWWRDHYRTRFLGAMRRFGNRWATDRDNVTAVAFMLAERAVRYAGDSATIDEECARKAAADVERYCNVHSRRAARAQGLTNSDGTVPLIAGYWCPGSPER